jgi:SOS response regulatory protein OraA/RecX
MSTFASRLRESLDALSQRTPFRAELVARLNALPHDSREYADAQDELYDFDHPEVSPDA